MKMFMLKVSLIDTNTRISYNVEKSKFEELIYVILKLFQRYKDTDNESNIRKEI